MHQMTRSSALLLAAAALALGGCERKSREPALFELLSAGATGVDFVNALPEDDPGLNILNYLYYYNGAGVAAGDVDGNGYPDLYFTSNRGDNKLYLNRGDYRFEDATARAGVAGSEGWTTGASMADVNGDGHLDIYVSAVSHLGSRGGNILYVNDGDGTFTDRTKEYGLEHVGYSTQAAFLDYDMDGDLDMYLLNQSTHDQSRFGSTPKRNQRHPGVWVKLFRNEGARFVDVSEQAGIYGGPEGYGLGVVASDFNLDGCPDLFIANDFQENDYLYVNDCDGSFTESIAGAMGHTSRFSMGIDAADFDNDARPDLFVLDMMPEDEHTLKTSANAESYDVFELKVKAGYHAQYARNTLQLNRGEGKFSEIGYLAGVHATDWSWGALFADLDNDGLKDLFVTNGMRRANDLDYLTYSSNAAVQASLAQGISKENVGLVNRMPEVRVANYAYRNNGDLTFTNLAEEWGLAQPGYSNGAVYVDLNNSGALDLVVSNLNEPAALYRSRAREANGNHYLTVALRGAGRNTAGIGAKVIAVHGGKRQLVEQNPARGFQSSVDPRLHLGLGASTVIDTLTVIWPDGRFQTLTGVAADRILTLDQAQASGKWAYERAPRAAPLFEELTSRIGIDYEHRENTFWDFNREPLIPHLLSTEGPALAAGDVNGDGLDDLYLGGAKWQPGTLLVQQRDGSFLPGSRATFAADSIAEDVDAVFFDANGDARPDLYVVSGGNEFWGEMEQLRDRLYLNDGAGNFRRAPDALPRIYENGGTVAPGDFDRDGDLDLFIGARVVSRAYGAIPKSHLLQNDGTGRFTDVTAQKGAPLSEAGMVSSAAWLDYDADGALDLVVVGEWMPVRVFRQEGGRFVDRTQQAGLGGSEGWWNSVQAADVTGDGRQDLVLGNLGLNSYIRATPDEPARLYVQDFDSNGSPEQILTFPKNGVSYPMAGRDELIEVVPSLRSRFPTYASFGASTIEQIFPAAQLRRAQVREARVFASSIAVNGGKGTFTLQPLPTQAQFAPVYASLADDFDGDGVVDLLLGGNFFGVTPLRGRYDASYGVLLRGLGDGRFAAVDMQGSGVRIEGQVRGIAAVRHATGPLVVVARNDAPLHLLRPLRYD